MGNFIEILINYKSVEGHGQESHELSKWLALVSRFNNGRPLKKSLVQKIEDHFEYYWANNKQAAFKTVEDQRFMNELPKGMRRHIYLNYLFKDFLYFFRPYFSFPLFRGGNLKMDQGDPRFQGFLMALVKYLEPRIFEERDKI